jgi:predicted tellurium resistance membrane protein TerC
MDIFLLPETWIALLTLTFLEIVLGVDNVIFISIVTNKLPHEKQELARKLGLAIALFLRIGLLVALTWLLHNLTAPLFTLFEKSFSFREIILCLGGLFLLGKSISEIHEKMEPDHGKIKNSGGKEMAKVIFQIVLLDIVFSFDSILTAVGLSNQLAVMIIAVVISMIVMMLYAGKISKVIASHPTLEILALSFLILIGFMLVLEGVHIEVPKGYIYFAVFFALIIELVNIRIRKKHTK